MRCTGCRAYDTLSGSNALAGHSLRLNVESGCLAARVTFLCPFFGAANCRTLRAVYDVLSVAPLRDDRAQRMGVGRAALDSGRTAEHSGERQWIETVAVNRFECRGFDRSSLRWFVGVPTRCSSCISVFYPITTEVRAWYAFDLSGVLFLRGAGKRGLLTSLPDRLFGNLLDD